MSNATHKLDGVFADLLREAEPFKPFAYYNVAGDCIELLLHNGDYFARRLDGLLTLYLAEGTEEVVGLCLKGVKDIIRKTPGIAIDIDDGRIKVVHVIRAHAWAMPSKKPEWTNRIRKIIQATEESEVETDIGGAVLV